MRDDFTQPPLFAEEYLDRPATGQDRPPEADRACTCPWCGTTEPNPLLLHTNHGVTSPDGSIGGLPPGRHPIYGDQCLAQNLATHQLVYAIRTGRPGLLAEATDRASRLGLDADAVIAAEPDSQQAQSPQEENS